MADCLFCGIVSGDVPATIVETSPTTLAFYDLHPQAPVHVLIVPKRHIDDASTVEVADGSVLSDMLMAAKRVADSQGIGGPNAGYRLVFNVGPDANNTIGHLHVHVIGGRNLGGSST